MADPILRTANWPVTVADCWMDREWESGAVTDDRPTIHQLTAEFAALTPQVEASKKGTPHEGHEGWSLAGNPHIARCACGEPMTWLNGGIEP